MREANDMEWYWWIIGIAVAIIIIYLILKQK